MQNLVQEAATYQALLKQIQVARIKIQARRTEAGGLLATARHEFLPRSL
jgi:hypothetical protein